MREIILGDLVVDQFPVYEPDGVTKRSGLSPSDFTVSVFKNAAVDLVTSITISEIASLGEYRTSWYPASTGYFLVSILNSYNVDEWSEEYEVVKPRLIGVT